LRSLRAISTELPKENCCINYFTQLRENGLGGSVIGCGQSRKLSILISIERMVVAFVLKTWGRCYLCASTLLFIARIPSGSYIVLIFKIFDKPSPVQFNILSIDVETSPKQFNFPLIQVDCVEVTSMLKKS
jgi:hypothetical protein